MHMQSGDRLGRYEIVSLLGKGGMGEVYRARDAELDREVAIKVLPEEVAADADRLKRFRREAKAVAKLSHSSILEIFDFGEQDDVTYAVTELLEGQSLREKLDSEEGGLPLQKARDIAATVAGRGAGRCSTARAWCTVTSNPATSFCAPTGASRSSTSVSLHCTAR